MSSMHAAAEIADHSLDFAFLDADHTYDAVRNDLARWWPKIKSDGILAGHDYEAPRDKRGHWGVKRAVDEFASEMRIPLSIERHSLWWCRRRSAATVELASLDARRGLIGSRRSLLGAFDAGEEGLRDGRTHVENDSSGKPPGAASFNRRQHSETQRSAKSLSGQPPAGCPTPQSLVADRRQAMPLRENWCLGSAAHLQRPPVGGFLKR